MCSLSLATPYGSSLMSANKNIHLKFKERRKNGIERAVDPGGFLCCAFNKYLLRFYASQVLSYILGLQLLFSEFIFYD